MRPYVDDVAEAAAIAAAAHAIIFSAAEARRGPLVAVVGALMEIRRVGIAIYVLAGAANAIGFVLDEGLILVMITIAAILRPLGEAKALALAISHGTEA